MKLNQMSLGPLGTNCYIISMDGEALVIDPGGEADKLISFLTAEKLSPKAILLTHAHFDHIGAVEKIRTYYELPVYVHELESTWLTNPILNGSSFYGDEITTSEPTHLLKPGKLSIGNFSFTILHTPGHSPGSVSYQFTEEGFIIGGDVLFKEGIGRTDLPGGDATQLNRTIQNVLYSLPENYDVYPGHGPRTTIGHEMKNNPFVSNI